MARTGKILGTVAAIGMVAGIAHGQSVYGLTSVLGASGLVRIDVQDPSLVSIPLLITGLQAGETIEGIDFRPANNRLYGLGSTGRIYSIDVHTGQATQSGTGTFVIPLEGSNFGFDFNPTVDRIRITSDAGQNLRAHPDTGVIVDADPNTPGVQADGDLAYAAGDENAGVMPGVVASAYINSNPGATTTTLYNLDADLNVLVTQNPPNAGTLNTVADVSVPLSNTTGFDVDRENIAYFSTRTALLTTTLHTIDLATGETDLIGVIGLIPVDVDDIAVVLCAADFDHTGFVDTDDFTAFVGAFEEGDIHADFDGSGFVDTDDFDAFVRAFEEGC
ncbi:MAG TPA: DUF4394 domain-containing protein [Phycisphaerales bacterium]|nr:DUF4394 domain-containing protein [Phycisphaerales bacterium]